VAGSRDGMISNVFRNGVKGSKGLLFLGGDEQYRSAEQSNSDINFQIKDLIYFIPLLKTWRASNIHENIDGL